jgi:hypothetical protein
MCIGKQAEIKIQRYVKNKLGFSINPAPET